MKTEFTKSLMHWHKRHNKRSLPWKNEKDPYRIWLSEIILQQTRTGQGSEYYEKFIRAFPTVFDLAAAPERKVLTLWEGLGYYTRCRNLMETARKIVHDYKGKFPRSYPEIAALKGIGPYTAAAIASFAFHLPYPVLDGNVYRILSRYFGITVTMEKAAGKKLYLELARELLDQKAPAQFNQAIMDLGAVICKPSNPRCDICPLSKECLSHIHGWTGILPFRKKKPEKKIRRFLYFILETKDRQIYIRRREGKDIWKNLYEFPAIETSVMPVPALEPLHGEILHLLGQQPYKITAMSGLYRQELTHQTIFAQFCTIHIRKPMPRMNAYRLVKRDRIHSYPLPPLLRSFLRDAG